MAAGILDNAKKDEFVKQFKDAGFPVEENTDSGTVSVKEGETVVFKAIQKSRKGPWIAIFKDGPTVKWKAA
jgi:hypothetical protein